MTEPLLIVLPWPHKSLTPNAKRRKHWRSYQGAISADRTTGFWVAKGAMNGRRKPSFGEGKIPVKISFYPPDKRLRDDDGMVGAFKHLRDGIADALGVDDHRFLPFYQFCEPEKPGKVEVVIGSAP